MKLILTSNKMEEHIRISTVLEFFQQHQFLVFVTARTTYPMYMFHLLLYHQYRAHRITITAIQYYELDADSCQTLWSSMLSSEGDNISRRDIEDLSRVAVNSKYPTPYVRSQCIIWQVEQ
jgi:hypothetical protein